MAPTVRPAGPGDLLGVLRVHERDPSLGPSGVTDRQRATWDRMMAAEGLTVYVACDGGEAVGVVSLQTMPNLGYDCRPSAVLEAMVVAEAHRRRAVGFTAGAEGFRLYLDR
ncbi:MAG TPA: GNAT family N-acetyltransferase [Acidimicrobiales bacterium]|nr:GNAT family N-acetyltransferase [Acidimicrobiales bacterium]